MALSRMISFCSLILLLLSCQKSDEIVAGSNSCPTTVNNSMLFIGNNDWIDYKKTGNTPQDANERTVAQIKIPALLATCTGFLINSDTLMTNNHCIGSASKAVNVTAIFRDINGTRTTYSCSQFITTSAQYDFTLVKCANSPGLKFGWVGLAKAPPVRDTQIYVAQENCDYISDPHCIVNKYVAFGEILQSQASRVYHNADTLGGSSGSPIFSEDTHQVVAIHNSGYSTTSSNPQMNAGIPMFQIRKKIQETTSVIMYEFGTAGYFGSSSPSLSC